MNDLARPVDYRSGLPDNYSPADGLEAIGKLEALESYYSRAKDATGLYSAVEAKLGEQRRFVLWWDGQEKGQGERRDLEHRRSSTTKFHPEEFGLDRDTIHRWRKRLKDPRKFDAALEAAQERCRRVCEADKGADGRAGNTGEENWYTPPEYVEAARRVLGGFDLDPASSDKAQEHVKAAAYFTKEDDGLAQPWRGRVWLNPPYSAPAIGEFVGKLCEEHAAGNVTAAVLLTNNSADTAWFHEAASRAGIICFAKRRIRFLNAAGEVAQSPLQGQAFFYLGPDIAAFAAEFATFGFLAVPYDGVVP